MSYREWAAHQLRDPATPPDWIGTLLWRKVYGQTRPAYTSLLTNILNQWRTLGTPDCPIQCRPWERPAPRSGPGAGPSRGASAPEAPAGGRLTEVDRARIAADENASAALEARADAAWSALGEPEREELRVRVRLAKPAIARWPILVAAEARLLAAREAHGVTPEALTPDAKEGRYAVV